MNTRVSKWRWWIHFLLIGGYFVPGTVRGLIHPGEQPVLSSTTAGLLVVTGINLLLFAVVFALGWFASRATSQELMLNWRPGWWVLPLGLGYSAAIRLGVFLVSVVIVAILVVTRLVSIDSIQTFAAQARPKVERMVDLHAMQTNPAYYWSTIIFVSFFLGGLREELWRAGTLAGMRALWPRLFGSRAGQLIAIMLIALIFGAGHLRLGTIAALAATLLGIFLGTIMVMHRSIWPAVFAHGLFDATSFALLPFVADRLRQLS